MPEKMRDVVVLLPGITGSELTKHGKPIWGWSGRALVKNLLTQGEDYVDNLWVTQDSRTAEFLDVESGREVSKLPMTAHPDGVHSAQFQPPRAGAYRVAVSGGRAGVETAEDVFEVGASP